MTEPSGARDGHGGRGRTRRVESPDGLPPRLGDSLARVVAGLAGSRDGRGVELFSQWEELVGAEVAAHAQPVGLEGDRLILACDDPAWATQLRWLGPQLLERIAAAGGPSARELVVRLRRQPRRTE